MTGGQPEIWGSVPMRNPHFTGRESVLNRLREQLSGSPDGPLVLSALHGLGGIGKTQLAVEYAYRFSGEYDVVWWISAEDASVTRASLSALAEALGVGSPDFRIAVRNALEALRLGRPYSRWLLIYDNAADPDLIVEFLPAGGGHVLITSRTTQWRYRATGMEIAVFDRAESVEFLSHRVEGLTTADADLIAEALGDLPLALEQAAALQVESGIGAREFVDELRERGKDLLSVLNESPPVGYPLTLGTVWLMSVEHLRTHSPDALKLLSRLAFFGTEPIQLTIFSSARHILTGDFGEVLGERLRVQRALRSLGRYSLARVDTVHNTVQVHRLVQTIERLKLPEEEADRIRHDVHLLLSASAPADPDNVETWGVYGGFLGHIWQSGVLACRVPEVREFCVNFARYLYARGDYEGPRGSRNLTETAIEQWLREPAEPGADPQDDRHVLAMRWVLGTVLQMVGEPTAAYEFNRETLERMQAVFGPEHEETLRVMNSLGGGLRLLGRFAEARELDENSLALHRHVFGPDDHWTLMAANNLAVDYRMTGDYRRALNVDRENLERRLRLYGHQSNQMVLRSRNQVARDLRNLGEYAESLEMQREVAADFLRVLDADNPYVLRARKNLAVALRMAGLYEEARELAEEVRERHEARFGADHRETLAACSNLVCDLRMVGELEQARGLGETTLARYRRTMGPDHVFSHGCAVNLAVVLRLLGLPTEAAKLDEQAHAGLVDTVGPDDLCTLTAMANLASDRSALGGLSAACDLGEQAVRRFTHTLGADHPLTLASIANLVADLRAAGERERAEALGEDPVHRLAERIGAEHPIALAAARGERVDLDFEPPPL